MIEIVDERNIAEAARVHSISWQESHRAFCTADFIALHTAERQQTYIADKIKNGSRFFLLSDQHGGAEKKSIAVVSVAGSLIEDLYVLPAEQNKGFGSALLRYAVSQCTEKPTLWILENNTAAARLYRRFGFVQTGRRKAITDRLDEIEFALEGTGATK